MELFYSPTVFGHKDSQFHPIFQESRTFFVSYCRKQADFAKFTNSQIHKFTKFTNSQSQKVHKVKKSKSHKNCSYFVASTHSELKMRHPTIGSTTFGQRVLADAWQSIFVGGKCASVKSEMPVFSGPTRVFDIGKYHHRAKDACAPRENLPQLADVSAPKSEASCAPCQQSPSLVPPASRDANRCLYQRMKHHFHPKDASAIFPPGRWHRGGISPT